MVARKKIRRKPKSARRRQGKRRKGTAKPSAPTKSYHKAAVRRTKKSAEYYNQRLELGLKHLRRSDTTAAAAKKIGVKPSLLRRYVVRTGVAEFRGGRWRFKRDRRFRRIQFYSNGLTVIATVRANAAKRIGEYMSVVRQFFETEDIDFLAPFRGQSIIDVSRKRYIFETRPNVLFRLDASGVEPFEIVYAIVKPE